MKLVVLGANGRTGKRVVLAALAHEAQVTAVVRSEAKKPDIVHERLNTVIGDPCDAAFLTQILRGKDAVISTVGGRRPTRRATSVYFRATGAIVEAARDTGLERVLVTSTALLFPPQDMMARYLKILLPNIVRSATRMEEILKFSGLNWTSARCGFLNDDSQDGYRAKKGALPDRGTSISRAALARFLVDAIHDPEARRTVFGVSGI